MFRGPMLFVSKDQGAHVDEIVIPDASEDGCHEDETRAKQHHRGMLIIDGGKRDRIDLSSARRVTFSADGGTGRPTTDESYSKRVSLNWMANTSDDRSQWIKRIEKPGRATVVELTGGNMKASLETEILLEIPRRKNPPHEPRPIPILTTWSGTNAGSYQIDDGKKEVIGASAEVYVYNWDNSGPEPDELLEPINSTTAPKPFEDVDFKWVYTLFKPPGTMSWKEWLDGENFPAPRTRGHKEPKCNSSMGVNAPFRPLDPPTATCDGVSYCEGEPC